jgi:hypothetical protein
MKRKLYFLIPSFIFILGFLLSAHEVRGQYCSPSYSNGSGFGNFITKVELDSINDSTQAMGAPYVSYDSTKHTTITPGSTYTVYVMPGTSGFGGMNVGVFIDFNGDGDFADAGEKLGQLNAMAQRPTKGSFTFTVPCTAVPGKSRIRVAMAFQNNNITPCGNFSYGETQDYKLTISDAKLTLGTVTYSQPNTLSALKGGFDQEVFLMQMNVTGCNDTLDVSSLSFNLNGTTSGNDIDKATVYYSGTSSSFTTAAPFGSVTAPGSSFEITGSQNLVAGDNYFWIAYDVSSSATIGNVLDAEVDSMILKGVTYYNASGAMAGNRAIDTLASISSINMFQTDSTTVSKSSKWNAIMGFEINTSNGAALSATEFKLNTTGTSNATLDLSKATIFYTGNSNFFDTLMMFGSYTNPNGSYSIIGNQPMTPGANYFWLAYDIPISATSDDSVDAMVDSIIVSGAGYTATDMGTTSQRIIISSYCIPSHTAGCANARHIEGIKFSNLNNTGSGCSNLTGPAYNDYSSAFFIVNLNKGSNYDFKAYNSAATQTWSLWIDYDHDGTFANSEWTQLHSGASMAAGDSNTTTISIPCNAKKGYTKMRVRTRGTGGGPAPNGAGDACTTFGSGETEEYVVYITDEKVSGFSSEHMSNTSVIPGTAGVVMMRIPVVVSSCAVGLQVTKLKLSTNGTTDTNDIKKATVYYTGAASTYSAANSFGSVNDPGATLDLSSTQTLVADTNYFWVVYDVDSPATFGNHLDIELQEAEIGGITFNPTVSAPSGYRVIDSFMTLNNISLSQPVTSSVFKGTNNNLILAIKIDMNSGAPVSITNFNFSTNGSTNAAGDISNARLYFTGSTNAFSTTGPVGINTAPVGAYNINSNQTLSAGSNYFWLAYDVPANAKANNKLDAELITVTIDGKTDSLNAGTISGSRVIENQYCAPSHTQSCAQSATYINSVKLNNLNNNNSGCTGITTNKYNDYAKTAFSASLIKQTTYKLKVTNGTTATIMGAWLDVNQNGTFDAAEFDQISTNLAANAVDSSVTYNVPCSAPNGWTKLRIRSRQVGGGLTANDACTQFGTGETEDYWVYIQDNPNTGWLGNDKSVCQGSSITITPGLNYTTYLWSTGDTTSSINVTQAGTYYVTASSGNCAGTDTVKVTSLTAPTVSLGNDTAVCFGQTVTVNAGAGYSSYLWSTGDTTQTLIVANTGNYSITVANGNGCKAYDTIEVTAATASVNIGNDTTICLGSSITLDAGTQTTYTWSTGATTQTINVNQTGKYGVLVINAKGCYGIDSVQVNVSSTSVSLANDTAVCKGVSVTVDAGSGYTTYLWNTGDTGPSLTVDAAGTYTVVVSNSFGCTATDSMKLSINALPIVNLGNDTIICLGSTYTLDAGTSGNSYIWNIGANTQTISVANAGTYFVNVKNSNNCAAADSIKIGTSSAYVWAGNDIAFCDGLTDTLRASSDKNVTYLWSNGATTEWIAPKTGGTYAVTSTNMYGCKATDSAVATVYPKPDPTFNYTFNGSKMTFTPTNTGGSKYVWDFGDGNFSTSKTPNYIYPSQGNFKVLLTITSVNGCVDTLSKIVVINGVEDILTRQNKLSVYPNPFADEAMINYELLKNSNVKAELFDLSGKSITVLHSGSQSAGTQQVKVDGSSLAAGTYMLRITIDGTAQTMRLIKQ